MEKRELGCAPGKSWLKELNKNSESAEKKGQKLQLPVRFESETLSIIENLSRRHGISKAETVRKLVNLGFAKLRDQTEAFNQVFRGD